MKNQVQFSAFTLSFSLVIFFSGVLNAQENAIKITPFQPLLGKFTAQYERSFSPKNTVVFEIQKWNERRETNAGLAILGIFISSSDVTTTKGYRAQCLVRQYTKQAFNGTFIEGGGYFGKHDIETRTETSSLNPFSWFGSDPLSFYQNQVSTKRYDDVSVAGLKVGAGWQKSKGSLTFECSGGLNINAYNSQNIRPTLSLKPVSPYGRIAVGFRFK